MVWLLDLSLLPPIFPNDLIPSIQSFPSRRNPVLTALIKFPILSSDFKNNLLQNLHIYDSFRGFKSLNLTYLPASLLICTKLLSSTLSFKLHQATEYNFNLSSFLNLFYLDPKVLWNASTKKTDFFVFQCWKYSSFYYIKLLFFLTQQSLLKYHVCLVEILHESMYEFWSFLTCPQSKQLKLHAWESEIIISILKIVSAVSRNAGLFQS